jgi:hypothetical protein
VVTNVPLFWEILIMGAGVYVVGEGEIYRKFVLSTQFCGKPKIALKNKVY